MQEVQCHTYGTTVRRFCYFGQRFIIYQNYRINCTTRCASLCVINYPWLNTIDNKRYSATYANSSTYSYSPKLAEGGRSLNGGMGVWDEQDAVPGVDNKDTSRSKRTKFKDMATMGEVQYLCNIIQIYIGQLYMTLPFLHPFSFLFSSLSLFLRVGMVYVGWVCLFCVSLGENNFRMWIESWIVILLENKYLHRFIMW